jgi:hypothetical protein
MIVRLGAAGGYNGPVPIYDYYGRLRDGNTAPSPADCLPFQCGAQTGNLAAHYWCAFYGRSGNFSGCTDSQCADFRPSYCAPAAVAAAIVAPPSTAPPPSPVSIPTPSIPTAPLPSQSGDNNPSSNTGTITVQTPAGPVQVPAASVPEASLTTPAKISVPNIWDSLDPTKASQFDYRGLSTSIPSWMSASFVASLTPQPAPAPASIFSAAAGSVPIWVWVLIAGAAIYFGNRKTTTTRAPRAPRRRKVAA